MDLQCHLDKVDAVDNFSRVIGLQSISKLRLLDEVDVSHRRVVKRVLRPCAPCGCEPIVGLKPLVGLKHAGVPRGEVGMKEH